MNMNDFTLIVPTHNRHHYIKRSIEYFKDLDAPIIYCDSSNEHYTGVIPSNIKYLHTPNLKFAEKILHAISLIHTSKVALCADDDFILVESLYKGDEFLNQNSNYSTVVGQYAGFNKEFDGSFFEMYKWRDLDRDVNNDVLDNAKTFFSDYHQILWAMYRKEVVQTAFDIIVKSEFKNDNFIELTIGACACYNGGIKIFKDLWGVREHDSENHWASRHLPLSMISSDKLRKDFLQFKENIDAITIKGYADLIIKSYFQDKKQKKLINKLTRILPKPLKRYIKKNILNKQPQLIISTKQKNNDQFSIINEILSTKFF